MKVPTCKIVRHIFGGCRGTEQTPYSNLFFMIIDSLNNVENLSSEDVDELLLKKEKFWIGNLLTQHKGMNGTHDWNRNKRCEREK